MPTSTLSAAHRRPASAAGSAPSVLFPAAPPAPPESEPEFFHDLNLDQLVAGVTAGREGYDLVPLFHTRLTDVDAIAYRQHVLRDLESDELVEQLRAFAHQMRVVNDRSTRARKLHYPRQRERWFVAAVETYCAAVRELAGQLGRADTRSQALANITAFLREYTASAAFTALVEQTAALTASLAEVRYSMQIHGNRIRVSRYGGEPDYSEKVQASFSKFAQGDVQDHRVRFPETPDMDHVEAGVLELVAKLYPQTFAELTAYCARNSAYAHPTVTAFDRELQFYLSYLEYIAPLKATGLEFCLPTVSAGSRQVRAERTFDVVLAGKLVEEGGQTVCNDFHLCDPERVLVVSGPNQGGKTTLARTFGQLHYLAVLGLPVPGRAASLQLYDEMFTHFERGEDPETVNGKLQDDLVRIHRILEQATPHSIVIMNEIFNSTTLDDAIFLGTEVMQRVLRLDLLCVCVSFIDELSALGEKTVSMVSTVVPDDPAVRTFTLVRKPADGRAYAAAIAEKYGLSYDRLTRRVRS